MNALSQLLKPLDYLRIKHPKKAAFDWVFPLALTVGLWAFLTFVAGSPRVFGSTGLVAGVNGLLQVLVGFYIAALAAIATFQKPGMDEKISGDPAILDEQFRGRTLSTELTRRRFLCYMFGYLAWASLALYFAGVIGNLSVDAVHARLTPTAWVALKHAGLLVYLFVVSNLTITTMLGLYYMAHRLHLEEPRTVDDANKGA